MEYRFEKEYGCLILRMPEELDHHQAEIFKEEADSLILKYPVHSLILILRIRSLWTAQASA